MSILFFNDRKGTPIVIIYKTRKDSLTIFLGIK